MRAAVAGASGYAGGEILRLLDAHPGIEIGALTSGRSAGSRLGDHHPHLGPLADRSLVATSAIALAGHDVVFLALPSGQSAALVGAFTEDTLVLDCSADYRLERSSDWTAFYGGAHAGTWTYGLPELPGGRDRLKGERRIAVPGCYPTAVALALWPAFAAGVVRPEAVVVAASGTSGAGRDPKPELTASHVIGSTAAYGSGGQHRHTPEIGQLLRNVAGVEVAVSFNPMLVPMARGILATCSAPINEEVDAADVREIYADAFAQEPFVTLLPEGTWPSTAPVVGSNMAHVQVTVDAAAGRLVAIAAIDNLTKGTAGGAVQCMNIALELPETLGLPLTGLAP